MTGTVSSKYGVCIRNFGQCYFEEDIGIIIFVSFILKKIKIIFIYIYLSCCKIPKGYRSNSSIISDYVNIV